ncbi:MAG: cytosolic protein [Alicyclobacillus sp.]|nr:cytosolic protein [Alicyclobacillus sp.]
MSGDANGFGPVTELAWEAVRGGYDLHVHVAPDVVARRIDDIDLAKEFLQYGLKGFVLKSHYFPTAERAQVVQKAVPGISVFGAVTLNHSVGGLNPTLLDVAGKSGTRMVWFPTVDADNEKSAREEVPGKKLPFWAEIQRSLLARGVTPPPIYILNEAGEVLPVVRQCLEIIAEYDMVLATGHLSRNEIVALVKSARDAGVKRIIVTHALFPAESLTPAEQIQLSQMGAFIEHCYTTFYTGKASWESLFESIQAVGADRCILSTDLGQSVNPPVAEGLADFAQKLLNVGFSFETVRKMVVENPRSLIEPDRTP